MKLVPTEVKVYEKHYSSAGMVFSAVVHELEKDMTALDYQGLYYLGVYLDSLVMQGPGTHTFWIHAMNRTIHIGDYNKRLNKKEYPIRYKIIWERSVHTFTLEKYS